MDTNKQAVVKLVYGLVKQRELPSLGSLLRAKEACQKVGVVQGDLMSMLDARIAEVRAHTEEEERRQKNLERLSALPQGAPLYYQSNHGTVRAILRDVRTEKQRVLVKVGSVTREVDPARIRFPEHE